MADEEKKSADLGPDDDFGSPPHPFRNTGVILGVLIVTAVTLMMIFLTEKIEPWEVGVRYYDINYLFRAKGYNEPLNPGYCIKLPYTTIYKFDRSVLRLDLPAAGKHGSEEAIRVRTAQDKMEFDVYVTILYRVEPSKAVNVKRKFKTPESIQEQGIKAVFMPRLKTKLSEIETYTQFFGNAELVREKVKLAIEEQNAFYRSPLGEDYGYGIIIDDVLIWDYRFPPTIESSMLGTVIATKKIQMEIALAKAAANKALVQQRLAIADAVYAEGLARGRADATKIDADAKAKYDMAVSEGQKQILKARAEGMGGINAALAGRGGSTYVGLEYAEVLKGLDLMVLPASGKGGINPLELNQTIRQLQPAAGGAPEVNP
jgi:regulator of protease activity HflC (stomatin/prohibitin superfamily)